MPRISDVTAVTATTNAGDDGLISGTDLAFTTSFRDAAGLRAISYHSLTSRDYTPRPRFPHYWDAAIPPNSRAHTNFTQPEHTSI
jgi:hypothetical protein